MVNFEIRIKIWDCIFFGAELLGLNAQERTVKTSATDFFPKGATMHIEKQNVGRYDTISSLVIKLSECGELNKYRTTNLGLPILEWDNNIVRFSIFH